MSTIRRSVGNPLTPFIEHHGTCLLDGGFATHLASLGIDVNDELWSAVALIEAPELIRQTHLDYFRAGADVAISATYQATFERLAERGIDRARASRLMRSGVALARDTAAEIAAERDGPAPIVAASVGPYGAFLADGSEYRGDYGLSVDELKDFHRDRLEVLASSGCDLLAIETIPSLPEAEALVALLGDYPEMPAWMSFSCRDGRSICDGTSLTEALAVARSAPNVVAAGFNCTDPVHAASLVALAGNDTEVVCYPNAGGGTLGDDGWTWDDYPPGDFVADALGWKENGATVIGGCCGTTPADIAGLAAAIRLRLPR